ncbi:MAG: hypothetical protein D4R73_03490 [Deltaproteobacteria bacterium]|jgi:hypothetical protein|nr:MAG: hypothetical protein D4R73_03490 [Deltaproteobacteria bacterium]
MNLSASIRIPLPQEKIFPFFYGLEKWFRLNPQWEVLSIEGACHIKKGDRFGLEVRYDRTENLVNYDGVVEELIDGSVLSIRLDAEKPRRITLHFGDKGDTSILRQEEVMENEGPPMEYRELTPWLKSVAWYLILQNKNTPWSKFWKFFMDRLWLKMSPSGRRIVLLVVIAEAVGFMFFLLFLIVHYAGF